jgi:hypothetical protein
MGLKEDSASPSVLYINDIHGLLCNACAMHDGLISECYTNAVYKIEWHIQSDRVTVVVHYHDYLLHLSNLTAICTSLSSRVRSSRFEAYINIIYIKNVAWKTYRYIPLYIISTIGIRIRTFQLRFYSLVLLINKNQKHLFLFWGDQDT